MIGRVHLETEQGTTSVHKFAIFSNSFPRNYLEKQLYIYVLHVCWPMPYLLQSEKKKGENKKKKKKKKKNQTHESNRRLGSLGLVFFLFLGFCFLWFLGFLVRCWFFEGLAKQHKSEGPRPHSLPVLPL